MNQLTFAPKFGFLNSIRQRLEAIEICHPDVARLLCKVIPAQCPFERKIWFCDRLLISIPPLCKFNPFYEQIIEIRFKSLTYLADHCGEDITLYC
jgi:hypothetical protein